MTATEEYMVLLLEHLNKHLLDAPETFYTKNSGRRVEKDTLISFLYLHCISDDTFDSYTLIQACKPRLVSYLLDEALSSLSRVTGDTTEGEGFYEMSLMDTALTSTQLIIKFDLTYGIRAIANELTFGDETRWVNVSKEHQQLTNLLQGATQ